MNHWRKELLFHKEELHSPAPIQSPHFPVISLDSCRICHTEASQLSGMVVNGQVIGGQVSFKKQYKPKKDALLDPCCELSPWPLHAPYTSWGKCWGQPISCKQETYLEAKVAFLCAKISGGTPGWARLGKSWSGRINTTGPVGNKPAGLLLPKEERGGTDSKSSILKNITAWS